MCFLSFSFSDLSLQWSKQDWIAEEKSLEICLTEKKLLKSAVVACRNIERFRFSYNFCVYQQLTRDYIKHRIEQSKTAQQQT